MSQEKIEIAVIGPRFEALLVTFLLKTSSKLRPVAIITGDSAARPANALFGYPGAIDNFTRIVAAHGQGSAEQLWKMTIDGCEKAREVAAELGIQHHRLEKIRILRTQHEKDEANAAQRMMMGLQDAEEVREGPGLAAVGLDSSQVIAMQLAKDHCGFWWEETRAIEALAQRVGADVIYLSDPEIVEAEDGIVVKKGDKRISAEFSILLHRSEINQVAPIFSEVLFEIPNYWVEFRAKKPIAPDSLLVAEHGNLWGLRIGENCVMGGARYLSDNLRGKDADTPEVRRFVNHLVEKFQSYSLDKSESIQPRLIQANDCLPCDEMPVAGPYHANHRLVFIDGFWGWGLNMFISAVVGIAQGIEGKSATKIPRILWPERHRSLS